MKLPTGIEFEQFQLDNGLKVYFFHKRQAPVLTFQAWVWVGSIDEKQDPALKKTGLAHLFEHMMFRGTPKYKDGEFDRILTKQGATDVNATTWFDRTNYYESVPSKNLEQVLELEADRFLNLKIDGDLLETEKGAVLNELFLSLDDPEAVAYDKLYRECFSVHPYRFTTIGTESEIRSFTVKDADHFFNKYYVPERMSLVLVGDIPKETHALLERTFGKMKPKKLEESLEFPVEPKQGSERAHQFRHAQITEPILIAGYHAPDVRSPDYAAARVLSYILMSGRASILHQAWVERGVASQIEGDVDLFRYPGLMSLAADLQMGKQSRELIHILDDELLKLTKNEEIASSQVERAKSQILLDDYETLEENSILAGMVGECLSSTGDPHFYFDLIERTRAVTPDSIAVVIKKYLCSENRTLIEGLPEE